MARSDLDWAQAQNRLGIAQFHLNDIQTALTIFESIVSKFSGSIEPERRFWHAKALFNKGVNLGALGRGDEALAAYDDLLARFGSATETPLREQVAKALFNKGITLGATDRHAEAIDVYDDLIGRFEAYKEEAMQELVAKVRLERNQPADPSSEI